MEKNSLLSTIYANICKDTGGRNESSKLIVLVRLLILIMLFYAFSSEILAVVSSQAGNMIFSTVSLILFLAIFGLTYYWTTFTSCCVLTGYLLVWIIANVFFLGWDIGVQHFIIMLLIFCYFVKYKHEAAKIIYSLCLFALRLYLFTYCKTHEPMIQLTDGVTIAYQTVNTFFVFLSIALISYFFSSDTQTLEGKLIEYNEQLMKQAGTDTLTGLHNRRSTMDYLRRLLQNPQEQISICMCDIDFFKHVNDTYGHNIGDIVLQKIAETFCRELPADTFVSRWGGEEFLLIFPNMNGDMAFTALGTLRHKVKAIVFDGGIENFSVSLTYGLVEYDYKSDLTTIIKEADKKLYSGKENGRDRIVF